MVRLNLLSGSGDPHPDWLNAMEAEHCKRENSFIVKTTSNYGIETCPANEWAITVLQQVCLADLRHSRRLPNIAEILQSDAAKKAELSEAEIIAAVLYTGPMVRQRDTCGCCALVPQTNIPFPCLSLYFLGF